ncbi:SAGA-associated factor 29 [Tribolium castaneum]|uniref:SAGA-associated factor 29 homolog-like Protein n=1 Tax=Tribolium castaneum TaxID=7070 RepID=D6WR38_TRICA|nr:PREDICTED: SAGA-associated factor 29 [Tribolium castaneum]EFA06014.1 SAGA-associated factor 29 homolog-like Protein [Tribolium castaneum]|eukprot:XP_975444.1 PREDICTED: SAGA-associated factor 29 [Tribolium castaneum]
MPFSADAIAAQKVQEHLKSLYHTVHEIEKKRQQSEQGINNIVKFQNGQDEKSSQHYQMKLKSLYKSSISHAEQEEDLLRQALQKIAEIRNIKNERRIQTRHAGNKESIRRGTWMKMLMSSAQTLPLFVGKIDEKPPALCGATPADSGYVAKVGDMVAALVKIPDGDGENWILAEVYSYNHASNKYEVDDILAEQNQKRRHTLSKRNVVPLPLMRANPETDPTALFPQGTVVMALYPTTSCFYKGIVNKPPATHTDEYEILFEDAAYPEGYSPPLYVAQRYVIAIKQKTKQA